MKISSLLDMPWSSSRDYALPDPDPARVPSALQEAQVVGLRFDAVSRSLGVIFDLRQSLHFLQANTGLIIATEVGGFEWHGETEGGHHTAWTVVEYMQDVAQGSVSVDLELFPPPSVRLGLTARHVTYIIGNVPTLGEIPVDYTDAETTETGVATWESLIEIAAVSFV